MRERNAIVSLAALLLVGCAGDERAAWRGPALPPAGQEEVPVAPFNAYTEDANGDAWSRSPVATATRFLRLDEEPEAARTSIVVRTDGESAREATITATLSGLRDDSVQAVRYVLRLRRSDDGRWKLVSARRTQRCARGRGHQRFSSELCV